MTQVDFYDKEQVDDLLEDKADASSVGKDTDTPSASGSLWARIKYVLAHWLTADTEQTVTAKKTFTVSPRVPTEPADDDSAINSFYANDSTGTVNNNLLHKDGNEIKFGNLELEGLGSPSYHLNSDKFRSYNDVPYSGGYDEQGNPIGNPSNANMFFQARAKNNDPYAGFQMRYSTAKQSAMLIDVLNKDDNTQYSMRLGMYVENNGDMFAQLIGQRSFVNTNGNDVVTIGTLIQALRYYGLIQ